MEYTITNFHKMIYNTYLYASRVNINKPFKARKDFSKISDDVKVSLIKLEKFFNRFKNIDIDLFFEAPYKIKDMDKTYINIDYFLSRSALKDYTIYRKKIIFDSPDNDFNIKKIVESLKFIKNFISDNQITINEYLQYSTNKYMPDYIMHLKNDNISFYVMFGFPYFEQEFGKISKEDKKNIFMDFYKDWYILKRKYYFSKKAKKLVELGMKKLEKIS